MMRAMTDKLAAVSGATGFIGSAVVRQLLAQGRAVRALVEPGANTTNRVESATNPMPIPMTRNAQKQVVMDVWWLGCITLLDVFVICLKPLAIGEF